jgi:hypothetical protein
VSHAELETISRSFHVAAGLDAKTVNERPSFVRPASSSPGSGRRSTKA